MKILFDKSALNPDFKEHAIRGIGRYVRELLKYFEKEDIDISFFDQINLLSNTQKKFINCFPIGKQSISQQLFIPSKLRKIRKGFDIIHFPSHTDCPVFAPNPYIITVLDLIYMVCSDLYEKGNWRARFARALECQSIKNAKMLIAISECTANDVNRLLGVPREKIRVVHLGVNDSFYNFDDKKEDELEFRKKYNIKNDEKIILYVGGIDQRKNYPTLLSSIAILKDKLKDTKISFKLIMVGKINQDKQYPNFVKLIRENNLQSDVIETGFLEDKVLKSLYGFSDVLFFPTLYEGFGLTPLEAMARGLPVVCSNTPAVQEVVEKFALTNDPLDNLSFAENIKEIFVNEELSKKLSFGGIGHAKEFTWEKTAKETLKVYEELYKSL